MENNIPISVGLPFLKCSSNPSQTVNKKTGKKSKTASTKKILGENIDRRGQDPDIDHEKSHLNMSLGNINNVDDYIELIENTKKEINEKLKENGKRQLRKDCVDNISIIFKPNIESFQNFSREEQIEFFKDSKEVTESILNIKFNVFELHFDEVNTHAHGNFMPLIDNDLGFSTFNAKQLLSLKNITKLNREYSIKMRERGWNVKDMNLYEEMSSEEKEKHKEEKKKYGRSSLQYKSDLKKELDQQITTKKEELKNVNKETKEIKKMNNIATEKLKNNEEIISFQNEKIFEKNKKLEAKLDDELLEDPTKKAKILEKLADKKIEQIKNIDNTTLNLELLENNKQLQIQLEMEKKEKQKIIHENYEVDQYYKKIETENKNLRKVNTILNKIISFVFNFLPNAIKDKLNNWLNIDYKVPTEKEINEDIENLNNENEETIENENLESEAKE